MAGKIRIIIYIFKVVVFFVLFFNKNQTNRIYHKSECSPQNLTYLVTSPHINILPSPNLDLRTVLPNRTSCNGRNVLTWDKKQPQSNMVASCHV